MALIEARGAGLQIGGRWLVRGANLSAGPGEVIALVGPNGSGKSTLMRLLGGDLPPSEGDVLLDGRMIQSHRPKELARLRAVLPQQTVIQFAFTAAEVVEMGLGMDRDADFGAIRRSLERTDAEHLAGRTFPSLSAGEQARINLARVLAQDAPLLLLDEPTAALDLRHQQMAMHLAREIAAGGGTVIAILHDLNLAAAHADRIAIMKDGRLVQDGPPWDTLSEEILTGVFGCGISVTPHPITGHPLVLPTELAAKPGFPTKRADGIRLG